jgi:transcriptional regulator with PAS, ATPase and Fis domain
LMGESGTGKEMIAQQIHLNSLRRTKPFVPVDCTNLSNELFSSQIFGHVKGAFTGAERDTTGFFRAADGGTIFLDEIGELPLHVQLKLLRVLQEFRVTSTGSTQSFPVDVRVTCATNRDLEEMVQNGTFRNDLYYRLNVMSVQIPPLRERQEDILVLAEHFLTQQALLYNEIIKRLSPEAESILLQYPWPGNIRELANAMEHAHILAPQQFIMPSALPKDLAVDRHLKKTSNSFPTMDQCNRNVRLRPSASCLIA